MAWVTNCQISLIIQISHGLFSALGLTLSLSSIENRYTCTWISISNLFALQAADNFKYQTWFFFKEKCFFSRRKYNHAISVPKNKYRIYSRISREILDKFRSIFFQFDLYAGHKKSLLKPLFIDFLYISHQCKPVLAFKIICNFGQFWAWKSCIRLIRGSTYTRVDLYASIYGSEILILFTNWWHLK